MASVDIRRLRRVLEHAGPGAHPSGSPQSVHGGGAYGLIPHPLPAANAMGDYDVVAGRYVALDSKPRASAMAVLGIDFEAGVNNLLSVHASASEMSPASYNSAVDWYAEQHDALAAAGRRWGVDDPEKMAAIGAALSPQTEWSKNLAGADVLTRILARDKPFTVTDELAEMYAASTAGYTNPMDMRALTWTGAPPELAGKNWMGTWRPSQLPPEVLARIHPAMPHLPSGFAGVAKAVRIFRGENPDVVLGGAKVRSFYNNLASPREGADVTVDTHMLRALLGDISMPSGGLNTTDKKAKTLFSSSPQGHAAYDYARDIVSEAARRANIQPALRFQALVWTRWRELHPDRHEVGGWLSNPTYQYETAGILTEPKKKRKKKTRDPNPLTRPGTKAGMRVKAWRSRIREMMEDRPPHTIDALAGPPSIDWDGVTDVEDGPMCVAVGAALAAGPQTARTDAARVLAILEHAGPGPHSGSGTPQLAHAGGGTARRARAWVRLARSRGQEPRTAYDPDRTDAAIRRRSAPDEAWRGATVDDLVDELKRLRDEGAMEVSFGGSRAGADRLAGTVKRELYKRGYNPATMQKWGRTYDDLPKLKARSKPQAAEAAAVRKAKMIDLDLHLDSMPAAERQSWQGVRDHIASAARATWWLKHVDTRPEALLKLVGAREGLGYKREAGVLTRYVEARTRLLEHDGPGPHPSGSEQAVHGGGGGTPEPAGWAEDRAAGLARAADGGRPMFEGEFGPWAVALPNKAKRLGPPGFTDRVGRDYGNLEAARAAVRESLQGMTWERAYIVNDKGVVEFVIEGDAESVSRGTLSPADVAGKHLLHSHPYNLSISGPDMLSTIASRRASCEAVLPNGDWWRFEMPDRPTPMTGRDYEPIRDAVTGAWIEAEIAARDLVATPPDWMDQSMAALRYPDPRPDLRMPALVAIPIAGAGMALTSLARLSQKGTTLTLYEQAQITYHRGDQNGTILPFQFSTRDRGAGAMRKALELALGVEKSPEFETWLTARR